uniref:Uncharacterized protein n=1 Tax=Magallana gigas TaxID=29159 RepID=K1RG55_MAGGI
MKHKQRTMVGFMSISGRTFGEMTNSFDNVDLHLCNEKARALICHHHAAVCNITTSLVGCSQQQTTTSFLTTCNRFANNGRKKRDLSENGYSERSKRVRRSTHDSDDVIDFEPLKYDPAYSFSYIPQIPTWRNGWNESHALQVCEDSINNDPVKLECEKHIDIRQMVNDSISSCILDIRDSASTEWVAGTIDAIKSYCLTRISKYEKFYVSNSSEEKSVVEIFNAVTCINNCSKHGHCTDKGECVCDTGFIGADCSHSIHKPPENIVLPEEGLCRQSIRPCAKTNIVGNFLSGTTIYVKLQQYKDSCSYSTTDSTTMSPGASPSYTGSSHTTLTQTTNTMSDGESSSPLSPNDQDTAKMILIIVSALMAVALIVVAVVLFLKCKNKSIKQSNPLYYNTEPVKNGCPPMNTYEHMYSRPFSPPPPYQDNRKQNYVIIDVPTNLTFSDINMAKLKYSGGSIWSPLQFDPVTTLVFIQTDRKMYAEKEEVKLRIVVLLPSLKPYTGQFNVEIIKIKTEKQFEVREYVIPKFKVQLICPQFYTRATRQLRCTVKARYFFGNPVTGVIHLQFVTRTNGADLFLSDDYADIQVTQPFFIKLKIPSNVIAGNSAVIQISLFNYDTDAKTTNIAIAKNKAVQFITRQSSINDLHGSKHGLALTSYVLQKAGYSEKARLVYADLKAQATSNAQYLFWQNNDNRVYEQKLRWQSPNPRARPVDIETSAYALLYFAEKNDLSQGMKIVNWLVSQRNPNGGFSSTQDTVVSLHALSRFSGLLQQSGLDVEVKLKTNLTEKTLDKRTTSVEISAQGKGFVLTSVKYNVMQSGESTFEINTTLSSSKQTLDTITVNVCIRRKDDKDNGMVVAEVGLPCGFKADLLKTNAIGLDHKETSSDKAVLYFKNLKRNWVCFDVTGNRVDSVTESQGVPIIVYDYYEPGNYGIASYMTGLLQEMNICQVCPKCKICKNTVLG